MDLQAVIFDYGEVLSGPPDAQAHRESAGHRRSARRKPSKRRIGLTGWITMRTF